MLPVPRRPTALSAASIKSGLTVQGVAWSAIADQYNHIMGMSTALVPLQSPDVTIAPGATGVLRFYCFPRYQASHRMWVFNARTTTGLGYANLTLTLPNLEVTPERSWVDVGGCMAYFETLTGGYRSNVEGELAVSVANAAASPNSAVVSLIGCFELTRNELAAHPSADAGVNPDTLLAGLTIYDGSASGNSIVGVTSLMDTCLDTARRTGFFHASPYFVTTSATLSSPFSRGFVVRGRKKHRTSTTGTMQIRAYCRTDAGTTGEVVFTMTSGEVRAYSIASGATGSWLGTSIAIDCDDFDDAYGRRSSRFDKCTVEGRRLTGAGNVYIDHVAAGEGRFAADLSALMGFGSRAPTIPRRQLPPRGRSRRANQ